MNTTPYINKSAVKKLALEYAKANRPKFTRAGLSFFERINAKLRNIIISEVQSHPSIGKTLK